MSLVVTRRALLWALGVASACGSPAAPIWPADFGPPVQVDYVVASPDLPPVDPEVSAGATPDVPGDVAVGPAPGALMVLDVEVAPALLAELHAKTKESDDFEIDIAVTTEGRTYQGVVFELHGGISRTFPKKSYRMTFPDDDELVTDVFAPAGPPEDHRRLVLQASWIDPTWLRNGLTMDLARSVGGLAPRAGFAVLRFNGEFHGLYAVLERVDRPYLTRNGLAADGNVYKAVSHSANWAAKDNPLAGFEQKINEDNPTDDLGELLDALSHTPKTWAAFEAEVAPRLHLGDFLRWQAVHTLAMNRDTFTKNYYLHHDLAAPAGAPGARFRIITWDADATWAQSWDGEPLEAGQTAWHGTDAFSPRLFAIPEWRDAYVELYEGGLGGPLSSQAVLARVDAAAARVAEVARLDLLAWERGLDFDVEVERLRDAVVERHAVMTSVLAGL